MFIVTILLNEEKSKRHQHVMGNAKISVTTGVFIMTLLLFYIILKSNVIQNNLQTMFDWRNYIV